MPHIARANSFCDLIMRCAASAALTLLAACQGWSSTVAINPGNGDPASITIVYDKSTTYAVVRAASTAGMRELDVTAQLGVSCFYSSGFSRSASPNLVTSQEKTMPDLSNQVPVSIFAVIDLTETTVQSVAYSECQSNPTSPYQLTQYRVGSVLVQATAWTYGSAPPAQANRRLHWHHIWSIM